MPQEINNLDPGAQPALANEINQFIINNGHRFMWNVPVVEPFPDEPIPELGRIPRPAPERMQPDYSINDNFKMQLQDEILFIEDLEIDGEIIVCCEGAEWGHQAFNWKYGDWKNISLNGFDGSYRIGEDRNNPWLTYIVYDGNTPFKNHNRPAKAKNRKEENKEKPYFVYSGYKFAKKMTLSQQYALVSNGYDVFIQNNPAWEFKEKEAPLNEKEECIVTVFELANYYALEEAKNSLSVDFNMELHTDLYATLLKKHIKIIKKFKRTNNG